MRKLPAVAMAVLSVAACVPATAAAAPTTIRVSVTSTGGQVSGATSFAGVSDTGRFVLMLSGASTLVPEDTNNAQDLFVRDTQANTTVRVDVSSSGRQAKRGVDGTWTAISAGGRFVVFTSVSSNLVPGDTNRTADVFIRDRTDGVTRRVSVRPNGRQFFRPSLGDAVSADGQLVLFSAHRAGQFEHAYLRDRSRGVTIRLAKRIVGLDVEAAGMSANGRMIAYLAQSSGGSLLFIHDRETGRTVNMLRQPGGHAFGTFFGASFTPSGDRAAFAGALTQGPGLGIGIWKRGGSVSTISDPPSDLFSPTIIDDGTKVAFLSDASDLVPGDTNGAIDFFVRDLTNHTTERLDLTAAGAQIDDGVDGAPPALSGDGTFAAFSSKGAQVVAGDTNAKTDVFERGPLA